MGRRLRAVDALRGITVAGMILVNNPGDWGRVYAPLRHAEWHGWTPTDLVFPFFLFIVGISIVLSHQTRRAAGEARGRLVRKILRRSVILFALGLVLAGYPFFTLRDGFGLRPELASIRIPGVLQRIAVCYLFASLLFLFTRARTQAWVCVACLLGYWGLMTLVPVPGQAAPDIDGKDTHLAAYLDRLLLDGHLWSHGKTWDPEGVLSTMGALATTLLGLFTGRMLRAGHEPGALCTRLVGAGAALVAVGLLWGVWFPINKPIWTSSYVVFTAGLAMVVLALCVAVVDLLGLDRWIRPFEIYGKNAITVFVLSGLLARTLTFPRLGVGPDAPTLRTWLYREGLASWLPPYAGSLAWALCWVGGWFAVLWAMERRGVVIKV